MTLENSTQKKPNEHQQRLQNKQTNFKDNVLYFLAWSVSFRLLWFLDTLFLYFRFFFLFFLFRRHSAFPRGPQFPLLSIALKCRNIIKDSDCGRGKHFRTSRMRWIRWFGWFFCLLFTVFMSVVGTRWTNCCILYLIFARHHIFYRCIRKTLWSERTKVRK